MFKRLALVVFLGSVLQAQVNTVKILDETAAPGGAAQLKVMLTSPQPVSTARMMLSSRMPGRVAGVAVLDASGATSGAAVINSAGVNVRLLSLESTLGTAVDYPLLTVTLKIPSDAAPGEISDVSFDANSFLKDALGHSVHVEFHPGTLTIDGKMAITNVIPGGGVVPAGGIVRVLGI